MQNSLKQAIGVAQKLQAKKLRVVFAESCTSGRLASTLGQIPGISSSLCGSFVIYRNASKSNWLGIDESILDDPNVGPVSAEVTRQLAVAALAKTPEAQIALAITGEIGPCEKIEKDGCVFCCIAKRGETPMEHATRLSAPPPKGQDDYAGRLTRLEEASCWAFERLYGCLKLAQSSAQSS